MSEDFDVSYQRHFVNYLLRDSQFLLAVHEDLDYQIFSDQTVQRIVRLTKDFAQEHQSAPNTLVFHYLDDLKKKNLLGSELHSTICTYIDELYSLPLQNGAYLLSKFNEFSRQQKIKASIPNFIEYVKKADFKSAEELMSDIFTYRQKKQKDLGAHFDLDPSERLKRRVHEERERLWTLVPEIDSRIDGLRAGELGVLQSQRSSAGKTAGLVLFTRNFLFLGKKVLALVLEGSREAWEDRIDACVAGLTRDSLSDFTALNSKLLKLTKTGGDLWISSFPMNTTKVSDLRKHTTQLANACGFIPDVIVVDYADLLAPETNSLRGDLYAAGSEVYSTLIGWLQEDQLKGWTAAQSGRGAMEELKADQIHMSQSIAKVQLAHLILSINSTEKEVMDGITRWFVIKNREGKARYSFTTKTDFSRQQLCLRNYEEF